MIANAESIKQRVTARDVFEHYGFHVNHDGYVCCPFHGEKTPSCKIYPGNRGWHCFGCHKGGDVLDFVQLYFGLDFQEAAAKLDDDMRLGLSIGKELSSSDKADAKRFADERRRRFEERRKQRERLVTAYNTALDEYVACDIILRRCKPVSPTIGLTDAFCWAAQNIDRAAYELAEAEAALFRFHQAESA